MNSLGLAIAATAKTVPAKAGGAAFHAMRWIGLCCAAGALVGCSTLPSAGPTASDVEDQSVGEAGTEYVMVELTPAVLGMLPGQPAASLQAFFGAAASSEQGTIRAGDRLAVTIWESGTGATGTLAGVAQIPEQVVSATGTITVPYAGPLTVAGLTPSAAQALIQDKLRSTVAQPQALVTVTHSLADMVTISGDSVHGSLVPLAGGKVRILDALAQVGGVTSPVYATTVQLIRGGMSVAAPMQLVMSDPAENIPLHPGDTLVVSKNPEYFTILGAAGRSAQVLFEAEKVSLAEALGRAGGLLDERADPAGVFVFRYQPREIAQQLCESCLFPEGSAYVPVVFRMNMREVRSIFAAKSFQMANNDLLYVANAPQVQVQKVLAMIRDFMSPLVGGVVIERAVTRD